jgi:hypothetical protein
LMLTRRREICQKTFYYLGKGVGTTAWSQTGDIVCMLEISAQRKQQMLCRATN